MTYSNTLLNMSKPPGKRQSLLSEIYEPQPAPKPSRLSLPTESGSYIPDNTHDNSVELAGLLEKALGLSTDRQQEGRIWGETSPTSALTLQPSTTKHSKTHSTSLSAHSVPTSPLELQRSRFLNSRLSELSQRYQHLQKAYDVLSSESVDCHYKTMYEELVESDKREKEALVRRVKALEEELERVRNASVTPMQKPPISSQFLALSSRLSYLELRLSDLEQFP